MKHKNYRRRGIHLFAGIAPNGNTVLTMCGLYGREHKHHLKTTKLRASATCRACEAEMKQRMGG